MLEDQWRIDACHVRRKGAALSVRWSVSLLPAFCNVRLSLDISSLMAQANAKRSWSPPASGCNRASSSRHILRSSKDAGLSTLLA